MMPCTIVSVLAINFNFHVIASRKTREAIDEMVNRPIGTMSGIDDVACADAPLVTLLAAALRVKPSLTKADIRPRVIPDIGYDRSAA
jgi:hypothetical protein